MEIIEYRYNDYMKAATENPTVENLARLGEWFEKYGQRFWNGECYLLENGHRLRPIQKPIDFYEDGEPAQWAITGWEIV